VTGAQQCDTNLPRLGPRRVPAGSHTPIPRGRAAGTVITEAGASRPPGQGKRKPERLSLTDSGNSGPRVSERSLDAVASSAVISTAQDPGGKHPREEREPRRLALEPTPPH
jgi:hypothetical protein